MFTVDTDIDSSWTKQDIALKIETCTAGDDFTDATVWDSLEDFQADLMGRSENDRRIETERLIVSKLIDVAAEHGWKPHSVWDSEEEVRARTKAEALDAIFAVDESTLRFVHPDNGTRQRGVLIVLGNGIDVISDYSCPEQANDLGKFVPMMEAFEKWHGEHFE
jgi:heme-degrading monooxygenase HmoA